jgi:hypothetical protein
MLNNAYAESVLWCMSAYDLICRSGYGLTCSSVLASRPLLAR